MEFIESDSVDFINFAYVLHEMPAENAKQVVREMFRVLKPGGVLNGFEVPYKRNSIVRDYFVSSNTWNEDWHVQVNFILILLRVAIIFNLNISCFRETRDLSLIWVNLSMK